MLRVRRSPVGWGRAVLKKLESLLAILLIGVFIGFQWRISGSETGLSMDCAYFCESTVDENRIFRAEIAMLRFRMIESAAKSDGQMDHLREVAMLYDLQVSG